MGFIEVSQEGDLKGKCEDKVISIGVRKAKMVGLVGKHEAPGR